MSISACCLIENCIIWMTLLLPSYSINVDRRWRRSYWRKGWCKWRYDDEPTCHQNEEWCARRRRSCNHFFVIKVLLQINRHPIPAYLPASSRLSMYLSIQRVVFCYLSLNDMIALGLSASSTIYHCRSSGFWGFASTSKFLMRQQATHALVQPFGFR